MKIDRLTFFLGYQERVSTLASGKLKRRGLRANSVADADISTRTLWRYRFLRPYRPCKNNEIAINFFTIISAINNMIYKCLLSDSGLLDLLLEKGTNTIEVRDDRLEEISRMLRSHYEC